MKKFLSIPIKIILASETILSAAGLEQALPQLPSEYIQNRGRNRSRLILQPSWGYNLSFYIPFLSITSPCTNPQSAFFGHVKVIQKKFAY